MDALSSVPFEITTSRFFSAVRRAFADGWICREPVSAIAHGSPRNAPEYLQTAHARLTRLPLEWREHAAAVVAAIQLDQAERERLGAYFTPPNLVTHVLSRLQSYGYRPGEHRIIDPAAGGAAFLAPLHGLISTAFSRSDARTLKLLSGVEVNPRLGRVTRNLLAWRLARARSADAPTQRDFDSAAACVVLADTLTLKPVSQFDVVVGNPPYVRVGKENYHDFAERFPGLTDKGGYLNLAMAFVSHSLGFLKTGGLLSFVMPAGFIGGPSFAAFRKSIAAEVLSIDRIERREGMFLDVQQDCVILTMRHQKTRRHFIHVTSISDCGVAITLGKIKLPSDGSPWELPTVEPIRTGKSLAELGWEGRVGPVVPHRWSERLTKRHSKRSLPLIWAAAIRPSGQVDYSHMKQRVDADRVIIDPELSYVIRRPCILVQRTANRKQKRRINAAVADKSFLTAVGPFVTENHVIALFPPADCASDQKLQQMVNLLNSQETTILYDGICGTASVSLKTLLRMKLPLART